MQKFSFSNLNAMNIFLPIFWVQESNLAKTEKGTKKKPFKDLDLIQMAIKETRLKEKRELKGKRAKYSVTRLI